MTANPAVVAHPPRERVIGTVGPAPRRLGGAVYVGGLGAAIAVGVAVRCALVLSRDFPLNDGGLFYAMVQDLQRAHLRMPLTTTYNGNAIPYAYSPLAFYVAAGAAELFPASLLDVFRFLPLVVTCLTLPAFVLLGSAMLPSRATLVAATFAFAVVPRSFMWLLMGGGITRSFGFLFGILALHQMYLLYRRRLWRHAAGGALFSGLTVLSHLGTAPFVAFSILLFWAFYGRHRVGVLGSVVAAVGAALIAAPWWLTVIDRFGLEPFLAAGGTGSSILSDPETRHHILGSLARLGAWKTGEPLYPIVATLGVLGTLAVLRTRQLLLPIWWVVILLFEERAGATYSTLPVAMLAGYGITDVLLPVLRMDHARARGARRGIAATLAHHWPAALVFGFFLVYGVLGALLRRPEMSRDGDVLNALTPTDRAAMRWVADHTPPGSRVAVVPQTGWPADRVSEWFPVLAHRVSVSTVQGSEWLDQPGETFDDRIRRHVELGACAERDGDCLVQWDSTWHTGFGYVFVPRAEPVPCCDTLIAKLKADGRFRSAFENSAAAVFERLMPKTSAAR